MSNNTLETAPCADIDKAKTELLDASQIVGIEITIPDSVQELQDQTIEAENQLSRDSLKQGFRFLVLKESLEHGEFENWVEEHGFKLRTVRERMQAAKFLLSAPESLRPKLAGLGHKKLIACASADEKVFEAAEQDPDFISDLATSSYLDVRNRLRNAESELINKDVDIDTYKTENQELKARLKKERAGSAYPDFVVVTRHESHALSEKAMLCVDDMSRLVSDLISINQNSGTEASAEFDHHLRMSTSTLAVHLEAVMHKASDALRLLSGHLPPDATAKVNADFLYSDEEISHAISERELLVREHEQEKQIRENQREMQKPRGRGRPKNSTKKD